MSGLELGYIIAAGIGALFLIISSLGGDAEIDLDMDVDIGDAEVGVDAPGLVSARTLSTFLLTFGVGAFLALRNGSNLTMQIIWGFGAGIIVMLLYYFIMKGMYAMQGDSGIIGANLVGKDGIIITPTTETGIAQVRISTIYGNIEYICREKSGAKLKQNQIVKIIKSAAGILTVQQE